MQEKNFYLLFPSGTIYKPTLIERVQANQIHNRLVTSAVWKAFLIFFNNNSENAMTASAWMDLLKGKRQEYEEIKNKHTIIPTEEDGDDPLSQSVSPIWQQYFKDSDLKDKIKNDVQRYLVDEKYVKYQDLALRIVFLCMRYRKLENYEQELHYFVCEAIIIFAKEMKLKNIDSEIPIDYATMFDCNYLEHDLFWVTVAISDVMYPLMDKTKGDDNLNEAQRKADYITGYLLRQYSGNYSRKLQKIMPPVIPSWISLLFYNQFGPNVEEYWTRFFAYFPSPELIWYTCLSIILSHLDSMPYETDDNIIFSSFFKIKADPKTTIDDALSKMQAQGSGQSKLYEAIAADIDSKIEAMGKMNQESLLKELVKIRDSIHSVMDINEKKAPEPLNAELEQAEEETKEEEEKPQERKIYLPRASSANLEADLTILEALDDSDDNVPGLLEHKGTDEIFK